MIDKLKNAFVATAAIVALTIPLAAFGESSTQVTYKTAMEETTPMSLRGYFPGTLKLTVTPNGSVQGWYFPDYGVPAIPVSGSDQGGKYQLSIGNGNLRVDAVKEANGNLVGSAQRVLPVSLTFPKTFSFVATPTSG